MSANKQFSKILIANRGEIAVRVIRACEELGIATVAVYSDADEGALHVQLADEAIAIGPASPLESYLVIPKIIEAAKVSGADAIHPGYGFLSENAEFAKACGDAGIIFIGPRPESISAMGNKIRAKELAASRGVPLVPGFTLTSQNNTEIAAAAREIGYPVLVKAAAGGGGKGMRVVEEEAQLEPSLEAARREALKAFGDGTVYIEKYLKNPHHIEFQVFGDTHGNVVHLFERECSIQRRHQKIVEETPSPLLSPALRERMGATAVAAAQAVNYVGAGTIEFLADEQGNFYFLEMNTRIQVEHAITEVVTGIDLVVLQIKVAQGEALPFAQSEIVQRGHAIQCRIYAEDPEHNFMPSPGKVEAFYPPQGEGIRCDTGLRQQAEIPAFYDPMIAKLIVQADTREQAINKMLAALGDFALSGIKHNIPYLRDILRHKAFRNGNTPTHFLANHFAHWKPMGCAEDLTFALLGYMLAEADKGAIAIQNSGQSGLPTWQSVGSWGI